MTAKAITPNQLETQIASIVVQTIRPFDMPLRAEWASTIALILATHRDRCSTMATGLLEGLEATHQGLSPDALDRFDDGWTPTMVRELVKHHRALIEGITAARVLLPKVLAGEP